MVVVLTHHISGHLTVIKEAARNLEIDKLIVIPTFLNPFKTSFYAPPNERLRLSKELFGKVSKVSIDDYEIREGRATPTVKTVRYFQKRYRVEYIIIGADNLVSITKWHGFNWLNSRVTWVIATRKGYELLTKPLKNFKILNVSVNISSTEIRNSLDDY